MTNPDRAVFRPEDLVPLDPTPEFLWKAGTPADRLPALPFWQRFKALLAELFPPYDPDADLSDGSCCEACAAFRQQLIELRASRSCQRQYQAH